MEVVNPVFSPFEELSKETGGARVGVVDELGISSNLQQLMSAGRKFKLTSIEQLGASVDLSRIAIGDVIESVSSGAVWCCVSTSAPVTVVGVGDDGVFRAQHNQIMLEFKNVSDVKTIEHYGKITADLMNKRLGGVFDVAAALDASEVASIKARTSNVRHSDVVNALIDLGVRNIRFCEGLWNLDGVKLRKNMQIVGAGWSDYESNPLVTANESVTTFKLYRDATSADSVFETETYGADGLSFYNFDADGNNGVALDDGYFIKAREQKWSSWDKVKIYGFDKAVYGGEPGVGSGDTSTISGMKIKHMILRENNWGITQPEDSTSTDLWLIGNRRGGCWVDSGQVIFKGWSEFQRGGDDLDRASPVFVIANAAKDCEFYWSSDRDAGHVFVLVENESAPVGWQYPQDITIDVAAKGCAWGRFSESSYPVVGAKVEWGVEDRYAVLVENGDNVVINGRQVQTRGSYPSLVRGVVSPLGFVDVRKGDINVTSDENKGLQNPIDLDSFPHHEWVLVSGVEYELRDKRQDDVDPRIEEPERLYVGGFPNIPMVRGVAGSLAAGEWDYSESALGGFNTLRVRLASSGNVNGAGVQAWHDVPAIKNEKYLGGEFVGAKVATNNYRSKINRMSIENAEEIIIPIKTLDKLEDDNELRVYELRLNCHRGAGVNNYRSIIAKIALVRDEAGEVHYNISAVDTFANAGDLTVGTYNSSSDLEMKVAALEAVGAEMRLYLRNRTGELRASSGFSIRYNGGLLR